MTSAAREITSRYRRSLSRSAVSTRGCAPPKCKIQILRESHGLAPTAFHPAWRWRSLFAALRSQRVFRLWRLNQIGAAEVVESVKHRIPHEHMVFSV